MTDYLEYNKGGYVLIAPSVNYKHQYILKCFMCDEYYGEFEPFLAHALGHNDSILSGKLTNPSGGLDNLYQDEAKVQIHAYEIDGSDDPDVPHEIYEVEVQGVDSVKNEAIKEENTLDDSSYYHQLEVEQEQNASIGQNSLYADDTILTHQDDKSDDEQSIASNDSKNSLYEPKSEAEESDFQEIYLEESSYEAIENRSESKKSRTKKSSLTMVKDEDMDDTNEDLGNAETEVENLSKQSHNRKVSASAKKFLQSDRNALAIIKAYRRQPLMWNLNYMEYLRNKERLKCAQKIANELENELNIKLTNIQVAGIIVRLRLKYREYLASNRVKHQSTALFRSLDFLRPFMENNYIAVLSEDRPYLNNKQISYILKIYKQFPILWNCNTIEHWCKNKRHEAVEEMVKVLNSKMKLNVTSDMLEKYLYGVNSFLTKEKRHDMGKGKGKEPHPEYYQDMMFLYDYVSPFKCSICHKLLRNPLYFKEHMREHDESIRFECTMCDKEIKTAEKYVDHAKRHMEDLNLECKECGKKFLKLLHLKVHMRSHTGEKSYTCDICGNSYRHAQSLVIHKRYHTKEYIYHCKQCPKKFTSSTGLTTHMVVHTTERNFVCKICNKAYKNRGTLRHHEWTHEDGRHPCELCGKIFKHKYKVYVHMKTHRPKS